MNTSHILQLGSVSFPSFTGERVYMREFTKAKGLPTDLSRWQNTVDAMLHGVESTGPIYIMIDQGEVLPAASHRRPGLHIDGYWDAKAQGHRGRHVGSWDTDPKWSHCEFSRPEAIILASSVSASRALVGEWDGVCGEGGDCSHIDTTGMSEVRLEASKAYAGNVSMLHESLPVRTLTRRTLVRLNVPGWTPSAA